MFAAGMTELVKYCCRNAGMEEYYCQMAEFYCRTDGVDAEIMEFCCQTGGIIAKMAEF